MHPAFQYDQYTLRRQVLALTGKFRLYNPQGQLVLFSQQKMFRLREDIRVYSDESQREELLLIKARNIVDFSAAYDVIDAQTGMAAGVLRRQGLRSIARDEWQVAGPQGEAVGVLQEDSMGLALLRRFVLGSWLPQNYDLLLGGQQAADLRQRFNPFRYELDLDFTMDRERRLDRRLGIAGAILLATIEGRQD